MSELARLDVERRDSLCLIRVHGEVDMSNADELASAMEGAVPNDAARLVVDLSHTIYLDSAGLRVLFVLAARLGARRQEMRLVVPEESPIRSALELTGLATVVPLERHLEDALATS